MAGNDRFNMDDYVSVAERIAAFKAEYPDGSLQAEIYLLNDAAVVMKAYAYRDPNDQRPGVGWSSLQIPGPTPFTRGAEIENCETSAWGRAIAALGFEVRRGVSSGEEVRNKSAERPRTQQAPPAQGGGGMRNAGDLLSWAFQERRLTRPEVLRILKVDDPKDIPDFEDAKQRILAAAGG